MSMLDLLELVINGGLTGLMYGAVALGIVLIFKSSGVANFAQGAMAMIGGYLVWMIVNLGVSVWLAIPLAMVLMFVFGLLAERVLLRRMVGQPIIMIVMLTLGLEIFLRGLGPGLAGSTPKKIDLGLGMAPLVVGDMFINRTYLVGGLVSLVLIILSLLFFRTHLGTKLRAVSNDHVSSWSVGISVERAVGVSWGLAGICAVGAGTVWGAVQGVDWSISSLLLPAVAVVILGGFDSIAGVLVGGLLLGILGSVIPGYVDSMVGGSTQNIVISVAILLTILIRPYGMFGREDVERV